MKGAKERAQGSEGAKRMNGKRRSDWSDWNEMSEARERIKMAFCSKRTIIKDFYLAVNEEKCGFSILCTLLG